MLVVSGGRETLTHLAVKKLVEKFGYCEYSQYLCSVKLNDSL
nr:MAG TPA: PrkA serine protein kinase C-terminal domain [Caudoviricetes sp.]